MIKAQCIGFLNTLPLWKNRNFDIHQFEFPNLELSSFEPNALPQNIRLGHQMEYVFKQLLEYSELYDIVVHNLQIGKEKRTLGEIDFIVKDKTQDKLIHVELTYKFYIIDPEVPNPIHRLIGPNRRDSLFQKMEKIKNRQFPLLHSVEGARALTDIGIDHFEVEHQCCFKAQLFKPYGSSESGVSILNKDCLVGYWLRFDDLDKDKFINAQFYMPIKSEWVIAPHDQVVWKSLVEIKIDVKQRLLEKYAPMIWMKKTTNKFEKFFVVWW